MNFVKDIELLFASYRRVADGFAQVADVLDTVLRGCINLLDIHRCALRNLDTGRTDIARLRGGRIVTRQRLGQDARRGGLTGTATPTKEKRMMYTTPLDCVLQRARYVFLANYLFKGLGTIFPSQDKVRHARIEHR